MKYMALISLDGIFYSSSVRCVVYGLAQHARLVGKSWPPRDPAIHSRCFSSRSNGPTFQNFNLRLMALLGADGYFGRAGSRLPMPGCMRASGDNHALASRSPQALAGFLRARQFRLAPRTPDRDRVHAYSQVPPDLESPATGRWVALRRYPTLRSRRPLSHSNNSGPVIAVVLAAPSFQAILVARWLSWRWTPLQS